jgi:DNA-binding ferritin-like protein
LPIVSRFYLKTKNFHWHVSGPHFRDYHLLLDEQGEQIFDSTDDLAERARKIAGTTLHPISEIAKLQCIADNNEKFVPPLEMLRELMNDNKTLVTAMREAHEVRASSRISSTKPRGALGSCSRRAARAIRRGIDRARVNAGG